MADQDDKIRREILKWLYEEFEGSPNSSIEGERFLEALTEDFDEEDVVYNVERMDGEFLEKQGAMGTRIALINIAAKGIEELHSEGYSTLLETEARYDILEILYEADRKNPGFAYISRSDMVNEVGAVENEIDQNIWYLKEKRLVETRTGGTDSFYSSAGITDRGSKRYEQYNKDSVEIPRVSGRSSLQQASIGPGESGKAENLFRDFVEMTQDEVIIIDRFAREGLYDLLQHVPSRVEIKVITTVRVTGQSYVQRVNQFKQQHSSIEVRELPDSEWDFHDRYIIRDREDGWAWGHSFHDAGDTQHTASELKPVNREQIVSQYESAWKKGAVVA